MWPSLWQKSKVHCSRRHSSQHIIMVSLTPDDNRSAVFSSARRYPSTQYYAFEEYVPDLPDPEQASVIFFCLFVYFLHDENRYALPPRPPLSLSLFSPRLSFLHSYFTFSLPCWPLLAI